MALKYCQNHKCHTYDTKDRKRGSKGNRVKIKLEEEVDFYYGGGNFCSMNCYNDWADHFMERAIDQVFLVELHEPYTLTAKKMRGTKVRYNYALERKGAKAIKISIGIIWLQWSTD